MGWFTGIFTGQHEPDPIYIGPGEAVRLADEGKVLVWRGTLLTGYYPDVPGGPKRDSGREHRGRGVTTVARKRTTRRPGREPIPQWVRFKEAARRLAKGFASDLRDAAGKPSKGGRAGSKKENPWRKCSECFHRVPELCVFCQRGRARVAETHPSACCPGECQRCRRCLDECPGPCDGCENCLDRCTCNKEGDQ